MILVDFNFSKWLPNEIQDGRHSDFFANNFFNIQVIKIKLRPTYFSFWNISRNIMHNVAAIIELLFLLELYVIII